MVAPGCSKIVRKDIARVLTVLSQNQREAHREQAKHKKYMPLDLRPKKTRALRRALSTTQVRGLEVGLQTIHRVNTGM